MKLSEALASLSGSYIVPNNPIYKKSIRNFEKNKLIRYKKKKRKKNEAKKCD